MRTHARVVVIGGGIVGCSVAYHLAALGWTDTILLERRQLSSGTTWHAAGAYNQGNLHPAFAKIVRASRDLFEDLDASGHGIGLKRVGSLRLLGSPARLDESRMRLDRMSSIGIPVEILDPLELAQRWPLFRTTDLLAAEWYPTDGYLDPSSVTRAIAERAISLGVEVALGARVIEIERDPAGEWMVRTELGSVRAQTVVNAGGQWAGEIATLAGVRLPILPMEHEYVVTRPLDDLAELPAELPFMREPDHSYYLRQEGTGLLVGAYERDCRPWATQGIPTEFGEELLAPDIERIAEHLEAAAYRVPIFGDAGIRTVVNGPDGYTPDHRFLMGEVPRRRGFWVLAGFNSGGIMAGPGAARLLANWIVEGDAGEDVADFDVQRFLPEATSTPYLIETVTDQYARFMGITFLGEEPSAAARPLKCSPIYDRLTGLGAEFGARNGWERAMWYAQPGIDQSEPSFRRPTWFRAVASECRAVGERVGVAEVGLAKFEVRGEAAERLLGRICANRLPALGRVTYTPVLTFGGGFASEFTVARIAPDCFYVGASAQVRDRDWLERWLPDGADVEIETLSDSIFVLMVAGPSAGALLGRVSTAGFDDHVFPAMAVREIVVGLAPVRAMHLSYTGGPGWELHIHAAYLRHVLDRLLDAGGDLGLQPFGLHAVESLRLEAGIAAFGHELTSQTSPLEAGLERWIKIDEGEFIGREALVRLRAAGPTRRLVRLDIDADEVVPRGEEPVFHAGRVIGHLASGGFGHNIGRAIGYAYVPTEFSDKGRHLEVQVMGEMHGATIVPRRWSPASR